MRRGLTLLLACAGVALTGCSATSAPPEVTFYSSGDSTAVRPVRHCDVRGENCSPEDRGATRDLGMSADKPVQISVPESVAGTPWQVAFQYRDKSGKIIGGRSQVFSPDERFAYTLRLPPEASSVTTLEVQQFAGALVAAPDGGISFATRGSWIVRGDNPDAPAA